MENEIKAFVKIGKALVVNFAGRLLDRGSWRLGFKLFLLCPRGHGWQDIIVTGCHLMFIGNGKFKGGPLGFSGGYQRLS